MVREASRTLDAIEKQAEALSAELAGEIAIRQALEAKVALLRPESLDLDMLDEMARRIAVLHHPGNSIVQFT